MKNPVKNFDEWIFEAETPKKAPAKVPVATVPPGYKKTTLPEGNTELSAKIEVEKAKGWKALPDDDGLQVSEENYLPVGLASDKVEEFNKYKGGVLVMSPTIYGKGNEDLASFIVGFPYQRVSLEGKQAKEIVLSEKYVLFTPFQNGKENVFRGSGSQTGAAFAQPYDFRLISTDKPVTVGMQSLLWILGYNNAEQAKKAFSKLTGDQIVGFLKGGLSALSKSDTIANANKSAQVISDGYNALVSNENAHTMIFNNFVSGHPKVDVKFIKENLPLKSA